MILVTGASGAMGSVLMRRFKEQGHSVRACVLPADPLIGRIESLCDDIRTGDIALRRSVAGISENVTTVFHLAAIILSPDEQDFERINTAGTRNIVEEAKRAGVGHFIYVSSASIVYPKSTPYAVSKKRAEEEVMNSGLNFTIIRPTLVYGPSGGMEFEKYLEYLEKFPVIPFIGGGKALKRPVFVDDIIDGLAAVNGNPVSFGKTYNFSGGESVSMLDFTRLCLKLLGKAKKPVIPLPIRLCRFIAWAMRLFMKDPPLKWQTIAGITQDADLDPRLAMADLGYSPEKVTERLPKCFPRKRGGI
jgi:nucleoside-diphosphate-sugar epimerase